MRTMQSTLAALRSPALILLAMAALAAPGGGRTEEPPAPTGTVYNVEMIIFRNPASQGSGENWSTQGLTSRNIAGDETATGTAQVGHFVGVLPSSGYQLSDLENRLRSGGYTPVAHVAWSQTASSWGTRAGFPLSRLGADVDGLTGTVFLEHGQFLHLGMTLNYAIPSPPPSLNAAPGTVFTINESRRVKFYDRNYFDHPAYGVIALVTPAQGGRAPGR
jgi:Peptidoglycan-binding protein, CsiV